MRAKDVMTTRVVTATPERSVHGIAALLLQHHISDVPVVGADAELLGVIGEDDLIHRIAASAPSRGGGASWPVHGMRAEEIMTRDPVTIDEDTSVEEIAHIFEEPRVGRVLVVRHGRLVGVVPTCCASWRTSGAW